MLPDISPPWGHLRDSEEYPSRASSHMLLGIARDGTGVWVSPVATIK